MASQEICGTPAQSPSPPGTPGLPRPAEPENSRDDRFLSTAVDSDTERLPRPPKARKLARNSKGESSPEDPHLEVASEYLKRLVQMKSPKQETDDLAHHFCATLAIKLRSLSRSQQLNAMHKIDVLMYAKMKQALADHSS
ncbi:hypothetical protein V5799_007195 [Amblyomma americanum]|uniref:Uncharacterized protein n=1 Tax=Amblyomma americanum TaxID=6943 RepID=A0AAQ4DU83_AMBAM